MYSNFLFDKDFYFNDTRLKILRHHFRDNISFMSRFELIKYCKNNNIYINEENNFFTHSNIIKLIINHRKSKIMKIIIDNTLLYNDVVDVILSFLNFNDDVVKTRKLVLLHSNNILNDPLDESVLTRCNKKKHENWFIKHFIKIALSITD